MSRSIFNKCIGKKITYHQKELNNIYIWVNIFIDSAQYILEDDEYLTNISLNLPSPRSKKSIKRSTDELKDLIIQAKEEDLFRSSLLYIFSKYESFLEETVFCTLQHKTMMSEFLIHQEITKFSNLSLNKKYKYLGKMIGKSIHDPYKISRMYEIQATRNLILHNNRTINQKYINRAGMNKRGNIGEKLDCNYIYFSTAVNEIKNSIGKIGNSIRRELKSTKIIKGIL